MPLSCSDELVVLSLFDLEALFVVVVNDTVDSLLIYVFAAFSPEELHDLLKWNVSAWFESKALLHCSVSEHPW